MRLIYTTYDADKGRTLANFLASEGIENQLEMVKNDDWGQPDYGVTAFKIWVIDEDVAEAAEKWAEAFDNDPKNPKYLRSGAKTTVIPSILPPGHQNSGSGTPPFIDLMKNRNRRNPGSPQMKQEPFRSVTMSLIMLCCVFFLISLVTTPTVTSIPANLPPTPFLSAPLKKQMLYDYPQAYVLTDKLINLYGVEKLQSPSTLPPEGQYLLKEIQNIPHWEGFYDQLLAHFQGKAVQTTTPPLFEKIREGEVWRLFTPALMHMDFLHILFNMLWLLILGKQLEERLNARRYILLILIIGIFSNTCQYLMSGSNFMGFSGVVCGMVAFIFVRQKIAPWEGYPLEKSSSMFVVYFILALLAIQIVSFYMEVNHNTSFSPGIANTAHITGALMGALLAFIPFFKKNNTIARPTK